MGRLRRTGDSSTLLSPEPPAPVSPRSDHSSGVSTRSRCLSEDDVLALCEGRVDKADLPRIDEHLDQCDNCRQWVVEMLGFAEVELAPEDAHKEADPDTLHPTILRSGSIVAERFRIVRFIKRGGMGEVYEAFDQMLETPVALKTIISTACDSPKAIRKLKAEVQLARSVRHPNVCSVFDFWEHREGEEDRVFFFTMEFIDGETLGQRLRRERLPQDEVRRLAHMQLLGLRAAHVAGVVHRDFKSDNVMLRSSGREGADAVVMDFGLARVVPSDDSSLSNDSEQFAGSVAYMAPEQVEGRKHIGTEADVFAFGVVLFEMLTGQLPWSGDSPWTTATKRLTERAPAPSRLASGISPGLDAFVARCLSRYPEDRFKDAQAALDAFDALVPAAPPRVRVGKRAAAIAVVFMLSALGITSWSLRQSGADEAPAAGVEPMQQARTGREPAREAAALKPQTRAPAPPPPVEPTEPEAAKEDVAVTRVRDEAPPASPETEEPAAEARVRPQKAVVKAGEASKTREAPTVFLDAPETSSAEPAASSGAPQPASDAPKRPPGAPARLRTFE